MNFEIFLLILLTILNFVCSKPQDTQNGDIDPTEQVDIENLSHIDPLEVQEELNSLNALIDRLNEKFSNT